MKPAKPAGRVHKPFHAVEVKAGAVCCAASKSVAGQRFLSRGVPFPPKLPMDGCDRPSACQCRYVHYDDRRTEDRRSGWGGVFTTWDTTSVFASRGQGKTRKSRGRRKDD